MSSRRPSFLSSVVLLSLLAVAGCTDDGDPNETPQETPGGNDTGPAPETSPEGTAGIVVTPTSGLKTTEEGGTATFTVALALKPTENVTIAVNSANTKEGTVDKATLAFTPDNWDAPQTVTITGVDDEAPDGPQDYKITLAPAVSSDARYNGLDGDDVAVTNADNDSAGITVTPTMGLKTSEMGDEATFTVRLNTKPTADVTIALTSSNDKEGTVSPKSLVFTTLNWNAPQVVTAKGVDDTSADGNQSYKIVTAPAKSSDKAFEGLDADDVSLVNVDDESPGITVKPTTGLTTTEAGGTATFTIRLNSKPTANVTIPLSSSKLTEGTVSPASVVFTADNWNAPQTVTVTGVDDSAADGNQAYKVVTGAATSTDPGYAAMDGDDVDVSNVDDESAGFTVTPTAGLITTESGGTATFTVRLNSKPNGSVTVGLTSTNVKEGTASPASLSFTTDNWNAPQTVTVTGVDDAAADGSQLFKIVGGAATGTDTSGYVGLKPAEVSVTNTDNDTPGFTVSAASGATSESGGTATFSVKLNSQPTGTVQIPVYTSTPTEGTASPSLLTFDATTWNAPQTVTVTGVDDFIADGSQPFSIQLSIVTGTDTSGYIGLNPPDVPVLNVDDDSAGITVNAAKGLTTTEKGGTATFTVKLNSQPTGSVTIPLSSSRTGEGTISPSSLVFTTTNWNTLQTVTLTGVNDDVADGNQVYNAVTAPATSSDTNYNGLNAVDVPLTNTDDDSAGIIVSAASGPTGEDGTAATFTIVLTSAPTSTVSISIDTSDSTEGTPNVKSVSFDATNWSKPQTVTVTGADDTVLDGDVGYSILTGVASSLDTKYSGMAVNDVALTNFDNEKPIDCTVTACGASCLEILKVNPKLPSGNYPIRPSYAKSQFIVYCHQMEVGKPEEFLNVNSKVNYSGFASAGRCDTCGDYTMYYSKIRFDPATMRLSSRNQTFASGSGGTADCYVKYACDGYALNYGSGGSCSTARGAGAINLGLSNPFAIDAKVTASGGGYKPVGVMTFSADRKSATISGGGGLCASWGFNDNTLHPVGDSAVQLVYSP